jgi:predicted Zn-dependent protease
VRCLAVALGLYGLLSAGPIHAQAAPEPPFRFTKVDLQLLDESNAVDRLLENRGLVYSDPVLEKHLAGITTPLLPKDAPEHVQWRFRILRDPLVSAFALPNGSIYVTTGLIARAENDDQLAGVLAHETAHVSHRDPYLFNRSIRRKNVAMTVISGAAFSLSVFDIWWYPPGGIFLYPEGPCGATTSATANGSQVASIFTVYGYSRTDERNADLNAAEGLKKSGRDPNQLVRVLGVMDQSFDPTPVAYIWQDHRKTEKRIAYLKTELGLKGDAAAAPDAGYLARMRPVLVQNIQMDLDSRCFRSAVAGAQRLTDARPDDPDALFWLAESYRAMGPRKPVLDKKEQTGSGQRKAYRRMAKLTEQEETEKLSGSPEGRAALNAHQRQAEELYRRATDLNPRFAMAQLGLGMLYQQENKPDDALIAYRKYLDLAPQGADRERVQRRMAALDSQGASR